MLQSFPVPRVRGWHGCFPKVDGGEGDSQFGRDFFLGESEVSAEAADQNANFRLGGGSHEAELSN